MSVTWTVYCIFILAIIASVASWVSSSCALAVFFLASLFLLVALLFFIMGAEFLAVLLLVIYAGAIILLFLFVVFLLNLRTVELYNNFKAYLPVGLFIALLLWATLCLVAQETFLSPQGEDILPREGLWQDFYFYETNLNLFGHLLYEHFGLFTILVAVLLLTVMCAVIIVTLAVDHKPDQSSQESAALASLGKSLSVSAWSKKNNS